jgi:hypothetical protein
MFCKFSLFLFLIPLYIFQIYGLLINKFLQCHIENESMRKRGKKKKKMHISHLTLSYTENGF